ncbi:light harvesting complex A [Haematococcus lacustris]
MILTKSAGLRPAPVASRGRQSLRVKASAVPPNVAEAREWIKAWNGKKEAMLNRPSWAPGFALPNHLDGSLPGDFGFDPLGLGTDAANLRWYVQAELVHARFAMLAVAGILLPELAASLGVSWPGAGVAWYDAGKFHYFAPTSTLFGIQMLLFAWVELRRYQDFVNPGSTNQDPIFPSQSLPAGNTPGYPGGIFDPFGWAKGDLQGLKVKEIKNGRLAMLAFAGFAAQAFTTGTTPLQGLSKHLASPWSTTVFENDLARL